jgi:hypothetical protein
LSIISFLPGKSKNLGTPLAPIMNSPTSPVRTQPVLRCVLDGMPFSLLCECEVVNEFACSAVITGRTPGVRIDKPAEHSREFVVDEYVCCRCVKFFVIPAQAGIQRFLIQQLRSLDSQQRGEKILDSRLRGNDGAEVKPSPGIARDTGIARAESPR